MSQLDDLNSAIATVQAKVTAAQARAAASPQPVDLTAAIAAVNNIGVAADAIDPTPVAPPAATD